jgi:DNA-binding MarR family transcriptional regulator
MVAKRSSRVSAAAAQVRQAAARLTWWTSRADVRRRLLGTVGELSVNDAWLLGSIAAAGTMRVSEAARMQGVDKSTISPQLRRLEERGLLERATDPSDGRVVLVAVTDEGRRWNDELNGSGAAVFADALRDWPVEDVTTLAALLTRLADRLTIDGVPNGVPGGTGPSDTADARHGRTARTRRG